MRGRVLRGTASFHEKKGFIMNRRTMLTAAGITAVLALPAAAGCSSSSHAGSAASSIAADPTAAAALAKAKADVKKCITGTPLTQAHTVKVLFLTSSAGKDGDEVKATRTRVFTCLGVPEAQRENFTNEAITAAEHAHLIAHPVTNGKTYLLVTLPNLVDKYQHIPSGVGTGQPSIPGVTSPAASKS